MMLYQLLKEVNNLLHLEMKSYNNLNNLDYKLLSLVMILLIKIIKNSVIDIFFMILHIKINFIISNILIIITLILTFNMLILNK
jgi:hypothetical protein